MKNIAKTTAVCAKLAANDPVNTWLEPSCVTCIIANGTTLQCKPKITKTCQKKPRIKPYKAGEKLINAVKPALNKSVSMLTIGPITKKPIGKAINKTKNGTKNV